MDRNSLKKLMEISKVGSFDKKPSRTKLQSHSKEKDFKDCYNLSTLPTDITKLKRLSKKNNNLLGGIAGFGKKNIPLPKGINPITSIAGILTSSNAGGNNNLFFNLPSSAIDNNQTKQCKYGNLKFPATNPVNGTRNKANISVNNLKLSNSMKNIPHLEEKKFRPISHSPKNKNMRTLSKETEKLIGENNVKVSKQMTTYQSNSHSNTIPHSPNTHVITSASTFVSTDPSKSSSSNEMSIFGLLNTEIENLKTELKKKEEKCTSITEKVAEYENISKLNENKFKTLKAKYAALKEHCTKLTEENQSMSVCIKDLTSELDFIRSKEVKLMEVMYLLKKRGISIDDVIKDVSEIEESQASRFELQDISSSTIYFPDKIQMPTEKKNGKQGEIPVLNFGNLPSYRSENSNELKENNEIVKVNESDLKFNKISFQNNVKNAKHRRKESNNKLEKKSCKPKDFNFSPGEKK